MDTIVIICRHEKKVNKYTLKNSKKEKKGKKKITRRSHGRMDNSIFIVIGKPCEKITVNGTLFFPWQCRRCSRVPLFSDNLSAERLDGGYNKNESLAITIL